VRFLAAILFGLMTLAGARAQTSIQNLPAAFREVLVLREVNDLSYREIAQIVDAPIGTTAP